MRGERTQNAIEVPVVSFDEIPPILQGLCMFRFTRPKRIACVSGTFACLLCNGQCLKRLQAAEDFIFGACLNYDVRYRVWYGGMR
jgi:hypothetical protein